MEFVGQIVVNGLVLVVLMVVGSFLALVIGPIWSFILLATMVVGIMIVRQKRLCRRPPPECKDEQE